MTTSATSQPSTPTSPHQLENHPASDIPSIVAARAGHFGVELVLDGPCVPVSGFIGASEDNKAWRLHADTTARMMEADISNGDPHPFAPALLVVGSTDAGDLLVDFEQLGAVAIEGASGQVADFQRGLLSSAVAAPWAAECRLVAIGIDGLSDTTLSRVEQPDDPVDWARQIAIDITAIADSLDRSPYEERVNHGAVYHPTIVFIGDSPELGGVAQHLAPVAEKAYTPLAVVSANAITAEHRIPISGDQATLEPFGFAFQPVQVQPDDLTATDHLVANASDTGPTPAVDAWAAELELSNSSATDPALPDAEPAGTDGSDDRPDDDPSGPNSGNGTRIPAPSTNGPHDREPTTSAPASESARSAEVSPETLAAIKEIMLPRPIEVALLGRQPTVTGLTADPSPKLKAIIAYLAFHREVPSQRLRDEFWPASTRRQAADNAIMRVRNLLGTSDNDSPRLESATNVGVYKLSDDIGTDWHRVRALTTAARATDREHDEAEYLDAVCELIGGQIGADASPAIYSWLLRDPGTYNEMETTLVDAAHRRGELALAAGDDIRANWAARKGLAVVEGQESLYRMQMRAAAEAGDTEGVKTAYRQARLAAESYGCDEEVQPETQALFESLTRSSRPAETTANRDH